MKLRITILKRRIILNTLLFIFSLLFVAQEINPQVVQGKLVDENGDGLASVDLQLYINPDVYTTTSQSDGSFAFTNISDVEDEQLPTGYYVSDNFPNPFNPTTRFMITLPNSGNVKVVVYNILGQTVTEEIERYFNAGMNNIDLELNGLPNGIYFARLSIDERYTVIKKMMLLYGSQHLSVVGGLLKSSPNKLNNYKTSFIVALDSLVATSSIIVRKTFTNLPPFTGGTLSLGALTILRYCAGIPTVNYEGKTYNTVQIGNQCWLKENLDAGTMVNSSQEQTDNGIVEKYCYDNDPANCNTYGGLYQWDEAMEYSTTGGVRGICPPGWHLPTLAEFQTLSDAVGGDGNSVKAVGQGTGGGAGTNTSGFSALLAGYRNSIGSFNFLGYTAFFWSSTEYSSTYANILYLSYGTSYIYLDDFTKTHGYSVRCLKN